MQLQGSNGQYIPRVKNLRIKDGDDASGDNVGVCVPRHGPTADSHASCEASFFYYGARSGGDGDELTIMIYLRMTGATSRIGRWLGVFAATYHW